MPSRQQKVLALGKLMDICHAKGWDILTEERESALTKATVPWALGDETIKAYLKTIRELLAYEKKTGHPVELSADLT